MLTDESLPFLLYRIAQDATTFIPTHKLRSGQSLVDASPSQNNLNFHESTMQNNNPILTMKTKWSALPIVRNKNYDI